MFPDMKFYHQKKLYNSIEKSILLSSQLHLGAMDIFFEVLQKQEM